MRFGYFDEKEREYVIEDPRTPMSWVNYLGTEDYCGIISNNASGYAYYKSARTGRLLRFRFNSIPMDRPGRYVYIRDDSTGDYWSASWQPVGKPLERYKSECRHGLGYTKFISEYDDIRTTMCVFVPLDHPVELWSVTLENRSGRRRELSIFAYAEWCFWNMDQDLTNFQYILYTCRMGYSEGIVDYSIQLWPFEEPKAFMASVLPVASFDTDREEFIGPYRHEGNPIAVERGACSGSIAVGGNPCGALHNKLVLAPGQSTQGLFIVGVGDAKTAGAEYKKLYSDPRRVESELAALREHWETRLSRFQCRTPSRLLDTMANVWNQYQCHTTFRWSRSASFNEAGGRDGLGFRDSAQDTLGVMHSVPQLVKARLIELLKGQLSDGSAMHGLQPLTWRQGPHNVSKWVWSDDHLWLLISVPAYIKETGDFAFLDEIVPYADQGEGTVYEHLIAALEFSHSKRGPHGLLLGLTADWNDCLNLRGNGESLFSTFLYRRALMEFIALSKRCGRMEAACFEVRLIALDEAIRQHAWGGRWFLRGYLNDGRRLGGREDGNRIFLNSQTWAVLSSAATYEEGLSAMDAVSEKLATEHGVVKVFPAYRNHDPEVGAITTFPPGLKENGGIFCHANTWAVIAECILGRGDRAFQYYTAFLPAAKNDLAEVYTMEPYVYSQFITGKEHPYKFGRARNSWLTGTASWAFVAASQYILGIRADYDGLIIDPCIPSEWDGFEVERIFRGAKFHITVRNPHRVCRGVKQLKVDGRIIAGNMVPVAPKGAELEIEAVLGAKEGA